MTPKRWLLLAAVPLAAALGYAGYLWVELRGSRGDLVRLAAELGVRPGLAVAEIGAGRGAWTVEVARMVGDSGHVYSTELDPARLERIREAVAGAGLSNVEVIAGAAGATNLPAGCCDAVFMRTVYHHFTLPHAMNRDLHRALREGGTLAVVDFEPTGAWMQRFRLFRAPGSVPAARGGHGILARIVEEELRAAGFVTGRTVPRWSRGLFLVTAHKPSASAGASGTGTVRTSHLMQ